MGDVYIYAKDCDDFANFGLVGALTPTECTFEEEANGMSEITLIHPMDAMGRYTAIERDRILMADVPVRTTPEIDGGKIVTSVEKWSVKATATKAQRTLYRKKTGSGALKVLSAGADVTVVQKPTDGRYKVKCAKGTGWMEPDGLDYIEKEIISDNSQSIESVQSAWKVRPQLFRIYKVEKEIDHVKAYARHISYDLIYNLTTYKSEGAASCGDALKGIMDGCVAQHEFSAYTNLEDARTGFEWTRVNPISALIDPETGLTARYSASLVRDNFDLFILRDPGMNRGVTVEYAKNMTGMRMRESGEDVVTRIIPVGEKKDGSELLLDGTIWVDSPHIRDYPVVHVQELKCENCKVGTDGVTTAIARARMREQAQAIFDSGADLPQIEMDVEFISLGDTAEYAAYKDLDRLFLWDYVIVRHKKMDVDVTARVVSIQWDCLHERMERMEIGSVGKTLANSGINTWQIPTGFSGKKIASGTVGGGALMQDVIATRHLQADSVNAEKVQAEAITADKLAAYSVTAEKLEAGSVDAHIVTAVAGKFGTINAGNVETDALGAELARISRLVARTADVDWAHIKDLTTDTAIITQGVGGKLMISRLAVTEANMVSLTTGELVVKGADGSFYSVSVDDDGNVVATLKQIGNGDVLDLSINAGEKLIEGSVTTACLNAREIFADSALVRELIAANLDVDSLFARDAFVDKLRTSRIYGGKSLEMIVGNVDASARIFRQEDMPGATDGVKNGDLWILPSAGQTWQATAAAELQLKLAVDEYGYLAYEINADAEKHRLYMEDGELRAEGFAFPVDEDGNIGDAYTWALVRDGETVRAIENLIDVVDGKTTTYYQSGAPASPATADIWYDTANGKIKRWSGSAWVDITSGALKAALDAAGDAQATADGKIRTFAQTGAPTGMTAKDAGDLWIDTDDQNKLYRWSGTAWAEVRDALITDAWDAVGAANGRIESLDDSMGAQMARIEADYLSRPDFERIVKEKPEGLYIGDNLSPEQLLLGSGYINFLVDGVLYSRMGKRQVQFGNYILGLAPDDGLAFRPAGG